MSMQENKDFIDLGSDPISDDFDPFASDDDLNAEIPAHEQQPVTCVGSRISQSS